MENLSEIQDDLCSITDLDLLKFQLNQQRDKLFSLINRLIQTELSYGDVIIRVDYEKFSHEHQQLTMENHLLQTEYQHLGHACLYLINKTQDLIEERNKYYQQWEHNRALLTPRPDWDKVAHIIDGGMERWKQLATGKSSEQLMDIFIQEIVNGNSRETIKEEDYFSGLGDDSNLLPFLRAPKSDQIINRKMRRRKIGLLIKEIWTDQIQSTDLRQQLADHVMNYFEQQCQSKSTAIEMGYNLRDACERYCHSEQINLFWGILTGQIEEFVYHHQMQSISQLLQHLLRTHHDDSSQSSLAQARRAIIDESRSSIVTNAQMNFIESPNHFVLKMDQFLQALKIFYPQKNSSQIDELFHAAQTDLHSPAELIDIQFLFVEDDEGRYGEFLSTLIKQMHEEKVAYIERIKQLLLGYPLVTVSQFSRVISMIDPKISSQELHRYIQWVFSVRNSPSSSSSSSSQTILSLDLEDLLRRLENCACFQH